MSYVGHEKKIVNIMILSNVRGGRITQFENQGFFVSHHNSGGSRGVDLTVR